MHLENLEDIYELSPLQQGLLFHTIYAPSSGIYFEQFSWKLKGDLNVVAFRKAWQQVIDRHPILRTAFYWQELEKPYQVVYKQVELPWLQEDWRTFSPQEQAEKLENLLKSDRLSGFDLSQAPLLRICLLQLADDTYQFVWNSHHLLLDGWSESIVFQEVYAFYKGFCQSQELERAEGIRHEARGTRHEERKKKSQKEGRNQEIEGLVNPRPYRDYITWLQQQDIKQAETFWRQKLKGFTAPTPLGVDRAPGSLPSQDEDFDRQRIELSADATAALQTLARQHQLTLNTLIQGAWALLLSRYSGESDIVFGITTSGRPATLAGVESMVGLFVNTLPLRVQIPSDAYLIPWLQYVQTQNLELLQYEYSPLVEVQGWSEVPRGFPLFESTQLLENYPVDAAFEREIAGLNYAIADAQSFEKTNETLSLVAIPDTQLKLEIWYDTRRFESATIARMLGHVKTLLCNFIAYPQSHLNNLSLLTEAEQQQLVQFNQNTKAYSEQCIQQLFEAQVEKTPDAIAVVWQEQQLTYEQLNKRANQLAHHLQQMGVKPEVLVGIYIDRSLEAVVSILAILKAGGAYVPLDPNYPCDRLAFMLEDAQISILLTRSHLAAQLPQHNAKLLCLNTDWETSYISLPASPPLPLCASPENLAYIIYTSGSTGKPKGVMVTHGNLVNAYYAWEQAYELRSQATSHLQMASFSFDVFTGDLVRALCSGGKLVLCPREFLLEPKLLYQLMRREKVNCAEFVPAVLSNLLSYLQQTQQSLDFMQLLIVGSDSWYVSQYQELKRFCGASTRVINSYGVSEATIDSTYFESTVTDLSPDRLVPIGRPFNNIQIYLLDPHLNPVPIGVPGELYIGGAGVAQGYLNRSELTDEKFIKKAEGRGQRAEGGKKGEEKELISCSQRLYKTGDLARWLPDGNIEFLGRIDNQVKIRGFRVELGEIEAVLRQHPDIQEAVVVAREDEPNDKKLVAYLVPRLKEESLPPSSTLLPSASCPLPSFQFLKQKLPDYMFPSAFVILEALPLTPNGKLDRKALPAPDTVQSESEVTSNKAFTPTEEIVAGIWTQVLRVGQIGIDDNFFELGGHSLLATQVISRLREAFEIDLPLRCLFESPRVAELAKIVETQIQVQQGLNVPAIAPISREGDLPLSFAQQRMWFLCQLATDSPAYNDLVAVRLSGDLNLDALEQTINEIVRRHEVLRTSFDVVQGKVRQKISQNFTVTVPVVDLRQLPPKEQEIEVLRLSSEEARQAFDLSQAPLLRTKLLWLDRTEYIFLLNMHHIVSDAWSMGVLLEELTVLYGAFCQGKPSPLPELPIQYVDFAFWQRQWLQGEVLEKQLSYWRQQLGENPPLLDLPTDKPRPAVPSYKGKVEHFLLPLDLTKKLMQLSQQEGVTLFMTLLAAFKSLLYCYSNSIDIAVGSPIANRNKVEIENLIGFFVNTLVLRTDLYNNPNFCEVLKRVREVTLSAYAHQDVPFEKIVEEIQPDRDRHLPLFQVWFVLQNAPLGTLSLPGLTLTPLEIDNGTTQYDLGLFFSETPEGLSGCFEYSTDLFTDATIHRLIQHFQTICDRIVAAPDVSLQTLADNFSSLEKQHQNLKAKQLETNQLQMLKNIKRKSLRI